MDTTLSQIQFFVPKSNELSCKPSENSYLRHRGYYTVGRRYEFYSQVVKTIFYERAQRVSKILFFTTRK